MLNYLITHVNFQRVLIISVHSLDKTSYIHLAIKVQESYARLLIISGTYREVNRRADGGNLLAPLISSVHSSFPYAPLNQFHHLPDDPLTTIRHFLLILGTGLVFITLLLRPPSLPAFSIPIARKGCQIGCSILDSCREEMGDLRRFYKFRSITRYKDTPRILNFILFMT